MSSINYQAIRFHSLVYKKLNVSMNPPHCPNPIRSQAGNMSWAVYA